MEGVGNGGNGGGGNDGGNDVVTGFSSAAVRLLLLSSPMRNAANSAHAADRLRVEVFSAPASATAAIFPTGYRNKCVG
jgi:hypothetical protein